MLVMALITGIIVSGHSKTENQFDNSNKTNMETNEKSEIKKLLFSYRDALNASDVDKVLRLYAKDGVFMPSGAPTAIGIEQVKGTYEFVFSKIKLSIEFYIDEIEIIGDKAIARSTSKGTTLMKESGEIVPEENRELFVLKRENNSWKIDRYMFNKMN